MHDPNFGWWSPQDADINKLPEPGCLVAYTDFKPWWVVEIRHGVEHSDYPGYEFTVYRLRPVDAGDSPDRDIHRGWRGHAGPPVLREHYGLCVHCGELLPCRAIMAERAARRERERMARYETPSVCPHCEEPVTHRMERETFPNIVVPLGPPVTFHAGRRGCRIAMERYRERVGQPETQLRLDGGRTPKG